MANPVLRHKFQQGWISKVVPPFENDMLMHQIRMLFQISAQTNRVPCIEQFHGPAKCCILNSLLMRQIQSIGKRRFFIVPFQPRPARKSILASDRKLRVTEAERGVEDFRVRGPTKMRVKFPDPLGSVGRVSGVVFQQVFRLILEMIEVRIRWEASYRHGELPFVRPRSALMGRKSVREMDCCDQVDFCPFRGPDAPFALRRSYHEDRKAEPDGYLLGSYRIDTAPAPHSRRL